MVGRAGTESDAQLLGRQLGDFVLRECIGEGAFAAVYRCVQPALDREAVIKILHHRLRASEVVLQRFMREARLASRIDHPYAAHVYAFGVEREDGLAWIAMEMVHGTPLDRWLTERGPLPLEMLVPFVEQVAEVVQNAHDHGIVHRDLKPSNVMVLERAGRIFPKLLDFGIAKMVDDAVQAPPGRGDGEPLDPALWPPGDSGNLHLTQANTTLGSPPYMSPEQWCDPMSVGPRSDLYSLAIMTYEALTGTQPFTGPTIAAIGEQHCNAPVPPVGERFPAALDRVFQRALAKDPSDRPATPLAFAGELAASVAPRPELDSSGVRPVVLESPPAKRRSWPLVAGVAVVLAGGVAGFTLAAGAGEQRAARSPEPVLLAAAQPAPAPAPVSPVAESRPAPVPLEPAAETREMVTVEIASIPHGAGVFRLPSETKVGSTPWRAELPRETGAQVFLVKKPGFADRQVEIDLRTGGRRTVKLQRAVHRSAPAAASPAVVRRRGEPVDPFRTGGGR